MNSLFYTEEQLQYMQEQSEKWSKKYSFQDFLEGNISEEDLEEMGKYDPRDPFGPICSPETGRK